MLGHLFAPLAMKLAGGIILALSLALGFTAWRADVWHDRAERYANSLAEMKAAQAVALKRAEEAKAKAEADYRDLSERIDDEAEQARAGAMDAAERYIAAHRVRPPSGGATGGPASPAQDRSTGNGEGPGAPSELDVTFVAVTPDDVRICTVNTLQAEAARDWALQLEAVSN